MNHKEIMSDIGSSSSANVNNVEVPKKIADIMDWRERLAVLDSALQKSIRWGEVDDARYFAQKIMQEGQPARILNRLAVIAAEDVGFADPTLVKYVERRYDDFESWEKRTNIKRREVINHPEACSIIDRAVIAAALCYKSRIIPMMSFATLYRIYKNETFDYCLEDYKDCFLDAVRRDDEEGALYYAYIIREFYGLDELVLGMIRDMEERRNDQLINEWIAAYTRKKKDRDILLFAGTVLLLFRELDYEREEYLESIERDISKPIVEADIPDRAIDKHTRTGKRMGRGLEHFLTEGITIRNERFKNDWHDRGVRAYLEAEEVKLGKTSRIIEAIKRKRKRRRSRDFIIHLPFKYTRAVLTQARTHNDGIYPFIVELDDGSRKFIKGPYKERKRPEIYYICNEIKKRLDSDYLHPIECAIETFGTDKFYLVCEELGKVDLDNTKWHTTKMEGTFEMLQYDDYNDAVPNPFAYMKGINKSNQNTWAQIMVNYCFRWVFGIGDSSPRNLMLQRSTGKIYSIDEHSIDSVKHDSVWHNKYPGKEAIKLVPKFIDDKESLNMVIDEVRRWKGCVKDVCNEFKLNSANMEARIDNFLKDPEKALIFVK